MKKTALFSTLFLAVFGLTLGITFMTYQPAAAIDECEFQCEVELACSFDTGPNCNEREPNYLYYYPLCAGGPLNCPASPMFAGCCDNL